MRTIFTVVGQGLAEDEETNSIGLNGLFTDFEKATHECQQMAEEHQEYLRGEMDDEDVVSMDEPVSGEGMFWVDVRVNGYLESRFEVVKVLGQTKGVFAD